MIKIHNKIRGEYRLVLNEGTARERDTGWMKNLILNQGLDRLGNQAPSIGTPQVLSWCAVGTGATAPAATQTALIAFLADTSTTSPVSTVNLGSGSGYATQYTHSFTFTQGSVVGNITEVGIGWATGGGSLFSRTLTVDGTNTPTAVAVVSLDQLTVYYRVTITPVITDLTSSVVISGITYPFTARIYNAASYMTAARFVLNFNGMANISNNPTVFGTGYSLGAITSTGPSGGSSSVSGSTSAVEQSYTNGNFYKDVVLTWAPGVGNVTGGIVCLAFNDSNGNYYWQYQFTTPIPKTNTFTLTLTVRISWSR